MRSKTIFNLFLVSFTSFLLFLSVSLASALLPNEADNSIKFDYKSTGTTINNYTNVTNIYGSNVSFSTACASNELAYFIDNTTIGCIPTSGYDGTFINSGDKYLRTSSIFAKEDGSNGFSELYWYIGYNSSFDNDVVWNGIKLVSDARDTASLLPIFGQAYPIDLGINGNAWRDLFLNRDAYINGNTYVENNLTSNYIKNYNTETHNLTIKSNSVNSLVTPSTAEVDRFSITSPAPFNNFNLRRFNFIIYGYNNVSGINIFTKGYNLAYTELGQGLNYVWNLTLQGNYSLDGLVAYIEKDEYNSSFQGKWYLINYTCGTNCFKFDYGQTGYYQKIFTVKLLNDTQEDWIIREWNSTLRIYNERSNPVYISKLILNQSNILNENGSAWNFGSGSGSTYNSTYATWAYNQTTPSINYINSNPFGWLTYSDVISYADEAGYAYDSASVNGYTDTSFAKLANQNQFTNINNFKNYINVSNNIYTNRTIYVDSYNYPALVYQTSSGSSNLKVLEIRNGSGSLLGGINKQSGVMIGEGAGSGGYYGGYNAPNLDVSWGGVPFSIICGAENNLATRTNNTWKVCRFGIPHQYSNEEPVLVINGASGFGASEVGFGYGTSIANMPTSYYFGAAPTQTTLANTATAIRLYLNGDGRVSFNSQTKTPTTSLYYLNYSGDFSSASYGFQYWNIMPTMTGNILDAKKGSANILNISSTATLWLNDSLIVNNLSGSGNAFACVDSNGKLYRSATACA